MIDLIFELLIFKAHRDAFVPDGEPIHFEHTELDVAATMLYGYAVENAIKACVVKSAKCSGPSCKQIAGWNDYDLSKLMDSTGISASAEEKLLLRSAGAFLLWAGRYPATYNFTGKNSFLMDSQFDHATVDGAKDLPPMPFDHGMRCILDELFRRLIRAAEA
jgi:hypothetical protein